VVAGGVLVLAIVTLATSWYWLLAVIAAGFVARVLTGPKLSPLGRLATGVVAPRLGPPKYVSGPPKRFAQGIGATLSVGAAIAYYGLGATGVAYALVGLIVVAATLESVFAICLGCKAFAVLIRLGLIPDEICERCNNIWA